MEPKTICVSVSTGSYFIDRQSTYCTRKDVCEQEPVALRETRMLRVEAANETDEGACTRVCCKHRWREFATKRILRAILDGPREETAVKVEDR